MNGNGNQHTGRDLAVTLAIAALGYFRWTQLVPMLMAWSFLLIMLGALALVNFQEQAFSLLAYVDDLYIRYVEAEPAGTGAGLELREAQAPTPAGDAAAAAPAPGAVQFDGEDLEGWVWRAWAVAALVGWLLGGVWRRLFGAPDPWPLGRKLAVCGVLAGLCSAAMLGIWRLNPEDYDGSAFGWIALFVGVPVGVWLVSAWSLSISHLLGRFADHLDRAAGQEPS